MGDSLMEDTKKELRALVESSTHGVAMHDLVREFRSLIGRDIPFRQMGYSSLEEFLRDIPDTVIIVSTSSGPMLQSVSDRATEHLERLVRLQKKVAPKSTNAKRRMTYAKPKLPPARARVTSPTKWVNNYQVTNRYNNSRPNSRHNYQKPNYWGDQNSSRPAQYTNNLPSLMNLVRQEPRPTQTSGTADNWRWTASTADRNATHTWITPKTIPASPPTEPHRPSPEQPPATAPRRPSPKQPDPVEPRHALQAPPAPNVISHPTSATKAYHQPSVRAHAGVRQQSILMDPPQQQRVLADIEDFLKQCYPNGVQVRDFGITFFKSRGYMVLPLTFGYDRFESLFRNKPQLFQMRCHGKEIFVYSRSAAYWQPQQLVVHPQSNFNFAQIVPQTVTFGHTQQGFEPLWMSQGGRAPPGFTPLQRPAEIDAPARVPNDLHLTQRAVVATSPKVDPVSSKVANPPLGAIANGQPSPPGVDNYVVVKRVAAGAGRESQPGISAAVSATSRENIANAAAPEAGSFATKLDQSGLPRACDQRRPSPLSSLNSDSDQPISPVVAPSQHNVITEKVKQVFIQILAKNPFGIPASKLVSQYKEVTGEYLHCEDFGCHSPLELVSRLSSTTNVLRMKRSKRTGDWIVLSNDSIQREDSSGHLPSRVASCVAIPPLQLGPPPKISKAMQKKIMQVLCSCEDGANLAEFGNMYMTFFEEDILAQVPGHTVESIFMAIPDIVMLDHVDKDTVIAQALPEGRHLLFLEFPDSMEKRVATPLKKIPEDAMCEGKNFLCQSSLFDFEVNSKILVIVCSVASPSSFSFHLRGLETSEALITLMEDIKKTYKDPNTAKLYQMPHKMIKPGQVCVAPGVDKCLYRATIISVERETNHVTVLYNDFGDMGSASKEDIFFLKECFFGLPSQAIAGQLSNCGPVDKSWNFQAISRFTKMVISRILVATVEDSKLPLKLLLTDTSGEDDVHISDTLWNENLAAMIVSNVSNGMIRNLSITPPDSGYSPNLIPPVLDRSPSSVSSPSSSESINQISRALETTQLDSIQKTRSHRILPVTILGVKFHLVQLNGSFLVPTYEVSQLLWGCDALVNMVTCSHLMVKFVTVKCETHGDLFTQLVAVKPSSVPALNKITLCPFSKVPAIFSQFAPEKVDCFKAVEELNLIYK